MQRLHARFLVLLLVASSAVVSLSPAFATPNLALQDSVGVGSAPQSDAVGATTHAIEPMVLWSVAAIAGASLLMSVFYLLKRKVGGFPEHPAWVAPITIMPSKNFADEGTFGPSDGAGSAHGADAHH